MTDLSEYRDSINLSQIMSDEYFPWRITYLRGGVYAVLKKTLAEGRVPTVFDQVIPYEWITSNLVDVLADGVSGDLSPVYENT
jgi:hypothetical protein